MKIGKVTIVIDEEFLKNFVMDTEIDLKVEMDFFLTEQQKIPQFWTALCGQ